MREPRDPVAFALLVLPCYIVARFLGVAVHEILGHGLVAVLLGGDFYALYLSPGQGSTYVHLPEAAGGFAGLPGIAVALGGIVIEIAAGLALLWLYPRVRGFVPRLFALLLAAVLIVHTLLYLAAGALPGSRGDTEHVVRLLGVPALALAFAVAGILWTLLAVFVISRHLLALLGGALTRAPQHAFLFAFWILPLVLAYAAAVALGGDVGAQLLLYLTVFLALASLAYVVAGVSAARGAEKRVADPEPASWRGTGVVLVALALIVPVWVGVFGLTEARAHGLLVAEPPVTVEGDLAVAAGVNVDIHVGENLTVTLAFRFRGIPELRSPLEKRIWATFDDRADFAEHQAEAVRRAGRMVTTPRWVVDPSPYIGGTVWTAGGILDRARVVPLSLAVPTDAGRLLRPVPGVTDAYQLRLCDPYRTARCEPLDASGFVDQVNLSWDPKVVLEDWTADPFATVTTVEGPGFRAYRNYDERTAPRWYEFVFRVFP